MFHGDQPIRIFRLPNTVEDNVDAFFDLVWAAFCRLRDAIEAEEHVYELPMHAAAWPAWKLSEEEYEELAHRRERCLRCRLDARLAER